MDTKPVIVVQEYNTSIDKVWNALTNKEEMKYWYFNLPEFYAVNDFEFQFYGGKDENNQYLHLCKITDVSLQNKLSYSWRYDGYPGISFVTFEVIEKDSKTTLKLTHTGIETFENENSDFAKSEFEAGWNYILHTALKNYLED
jgi:uncharacterized protein YndB with AHSA1/START domain